MLFKWFDSRGMIFGGEGDVRMVSVRNAHDLSDFNSRLSHKTERLREMLAESQKRSEPFFSQMASHIAVPRPKLTRPIF